jgi:hypothetical protein
VAPSEPPAAGHDATAKILELVRQERDAALEQYVAAVTAQLEQLRQSVALQQEEARAAWRRSTRTTMVAVSAAAGTLVVAMLIIAWLPLRAMKRLAGSLAAQPSVQVLLQSQASAALLAPPVAPAGTEREGPGARLHAAIERLDQRLAALETLSPSAPEPASLPARQSRGEPLAPRPAAALKSGGTPHLALTLGEGEALMFFPKEGARNRLRLVRTFFAKLKRWGRLPPAARPAH